MSVQCKFLPAPFGEIGKKGLDKKQDDLPSFKELNLPVIDKELAERMLAMKKEDLPELFGGTLNEVQMRYFEERLTKLQALLKGEMEKDEERDWDRKMIWSEEDFEDEKHANILQERLKKKSTQLFPSLMKNAKVEGATEEGLHEPEEKLYNTLYKTWEAKIEANTSPEYRLEFILNILDMGNYFVKDEDENLGKTTTSVTERLCSKFLNREVLKCFVNRKLAAMKKVKAVIGAEEESWKKTVIKKDDGYFVQKEIFAYHVEDRIRNNFNNALKAEQDKQGKVFSEAEIEAFKNSYYKNEEIRKAAEDAELKKVRKDFIIVKAADKNPKEFAELATLDAFERKICDDEFLPNYTGDSALNDRRKYIRDCADDQGKLQEWEDLALETKDFDMPVFEKDNPRVADVSRNNAKLEVQQVSIEKGRELMSESFPETKVDTLTVGDQKYKKVVHNPINDYHFDNKRVKEERNKALLTEIRENEEKQKSSWKRRRYGENDREARKRSVKLKKLVSMVAVNMCASSKETFDAYSVLMLKNDVCTVDEKKARISAFEAIFGVLFKYDMRKLERVMDTKTNRVDLEAPEMVEQKLLLQAIADLDDDLLSEYSALIDDPDMVDEARKPLCALDKDQLGVVKLKRDICKKMFEDGRNKDSNEKVDQPSVVYGTRAKELPGNLLDSRTIGNVETRIGNNIKSKRKQNGKWII